MIAGYFVPIIFIAIGKRFVWIHIGCLVLCGYVVLYMKMPFGKNIFQVHLQV